MNARKFFNAVVELRKQQRAVERSKGKDRIAISSAKHWADIIDNEIARVQIIERERAQPKLDL